MIYPYIKFYFYSFYKNVKLFVKTNLIIGKDIVIRINKKARRN